MSGGGKLAAVGAAIVGLWLAFRGGGTSPTPPTPPSPSPAQNVTVEPGLYYRFTWKRAGGTMTGHNLALFVSNTMYQQFAFTNVTSESLPDPNTVQVVGQATKAEQFDLPLEHGPVTLVSISGLHLETLNA